jgi:large subunit ribosomal protein L7/L12
MERKMADIQQLEDQIVSLSLLEASALVKKLEERLGVSAAAAAVAAAPAAGGGAAAPAAEEKTEFAIHLTSAGDKKINVIKVVREVTSLGLKEAKDLVDGAPKPLKENISKDDAAAIAKKFEGVATVEIK